MTKICSWLVASSLAALSWSGSAQAQSGAPIADPPAADSGDIIVTAQKRTESIQKVPLSITAITGSFLETRNITSFQDYATLVPNIAFAYASSSIAGSQSIALRGVFGAGTTGLYLDESPLPSSIDTRIVDLDRIEVLRGPQGTLYGARSMGGTVRLITTQPDGKEVSARLHVGGSFTKEGGFNNTTDGTINLPIAGDALSVRVNGFYDRDTGVFDRIPSAAAPVAFATQKNVDTISKWGGSVAFRSELADGKLVITPRVLIQRTKYDGRPYADISPDNFTQRRLFNIQEPGSDDYEVYTLTGSYNLGFGQITSASSLVKRRSTDSEDISEFGPLFFGLPQAVPSIIRLNVRSEAFSQELRFNSSFQGPFQITAGAFYQRQKTRSQFPPTPFVPYIDDLFSDLRNLIVTERAVFAEGSLKLTPKITATVGGRYFKNKTDIDAVQGGLIQTPGSFSGNQRESGFNPKFNLRYEPSNDVTLYANAAKGYRIGGANLFPATFCGPGLTQIGLDPNSARGFKSDSVWSYELGGKASLFDRRVRVSGAVFQIDWDDIQQVVVIPTCGFGVNVNVGKARNRGFELEGTAKLAPGLTLGLGGGYTDAKIVAAGSSISTVVVGSRVQQVPRWTFNSNLAWDFKVGSLPTFATADYNYVGSSLSAFNDAANPRLRPAYSLVNFRLGIRPGGLEIAAFVKNLFDEHVNYSDVPPLGAELPGRPRIATNRPRTIGIDLRKSF